MKLLPSSQSPGLAAIFLRFLGAIPGFSVVRSETFFLMNSCAAFLYLLAEELQKQLKEKVGGSNFFSFLVDGSQAAKKRLTFESELFYVRTCQAGVPKVEFFNLASMQQYCNVTAANLTHVVLRRSCSVTRKMP